MNEENQSRESTLFQMVQSTPMSEADLQVAPLLLQGIKQAELGEEARALEIFHTAACQSPKSFKASYLLGRTALSMEKFPEAAEALGNALALDPENIEVRYLLAHAHVLQDMVEEAAGELQEILNDCPDFVDAYYDCGVVLQLLGRYDDAIAIFRRRLEFSPDFDTAIMCAMTFEMLQDFENTEKYYAEALALDPENVMVIESHGKTLIELERFEDALADFERALSIDPDSPDALCGRGQTRFHLGDVEGAKKDLQKTAKLDPENVIAWSMLGQIELYEENYSEALKCLEKAIDMDPELLVYDFRADAKRGLGDLDGALVDIRQALEYEPGNVDYLIDEGSILVQMERVEDALKIFNQLIAKDPSAEAYRFRGLALMEQMEYERAIADFNEAERLGATNTDIFLRRGEAQYFLGFPAEGLSDIRRAQQTAEAEGDAHLADRCKTLIENLKVLWKE